MNTGEVIERLRRRPAHCLYCTAPAASSEHALPEALGGRLTAEILCSAHNNEIGARTDAGLFENVRPLINMLRVKRHDGRVGTDFEGTTDAGDRAVVTADGRVPGPKLIVEQRDDRKRIVRATGDLAVLEGLREQGAFANGEEEPVIATPVRPPVVNFGVGSDRASEAGVLKIALHFVAGFFTDIPLELARQLLPAVFGERLAGGAYVRTPPFNHVLFPASWPPEHRITCWAEPDVVFVGVLLFDAYPYLCRLPIAIGNTRAVRYRQPLLGDPAPILEENVPSGAACWDTRVGEEQANSWGAEIKRRLDRVAMYANEREIREQCQRAARLAAEQAARGGDFFEWYRGALQIECLAADEVDERVRLGRIADARGRPVWAFPITFAEPK